MTQDSRQVLLESYAGGESRSWCFSGLEEEICATTPAEVMPALMRIEEAISRGRHAAGFLSYEAAAGLHHHLATPPHGTFPLLWFGIYHERIAAPPSRLALQEETAGYLLGDRGLSMTAEEHAAAVARIRQYIATGDTYQVNFTLRQRFDFSGSEKALYHDLCRAQRAPYCAFLDTGRYNILSASPELFFRLQDGVLTTRPMKGTAPRGRWREEDLKILHTFRADAKERAENLMIVDLLRNDMSMVAETGSVQVNSLFDVETLETVHQMTSTIAARLRAGVSLVELFQSLFPCGSVTGAPKRRTMEIIAELEDSPRNLYTGCIGYVSPGQEAVFSVAIRTMVIDRQSGSAELGLGGGITWESVAEKEYAECLAKGRFARTRIPEFKLLESLLHEEEHGYFLLERHLARLSRSAAYFNFSLDTASVREELERVSSSLEGAHKIRLLLSRDGSFTVESELLSGETASSTARVAFAERRVDSATPFLFHKTDNRTFYNEELARNPGYVDVILLNERDEVTEGTFNNIVVCLDGDLFTPPLNSGLLPGVFREDLLASGIIRERTITREELEQAKEIYLINSVRKWRKVLLQA